MPRNRANSKSETEMSCDKTERRKTGNNSSEKMDMDGQLLTNQTQERRMMIFDGTNKCQTNLAYPPRTGIREVTERLLRDQKKKETRKWVLISVDDRRDRSSSGNLGRWAMIADCALCGAKGHRWFGRRL